MYYIVTGYRSLSNIHLSNMNSGIYQIRNLINDKRYIGLTKCFRTRKTVHFTQLRRNIHTNPKLQHSFNKYGEQNFIFEIIEECEEKRLEEREVFWVSFYNSLENGYNCKEPGIRGGSVAKKYKWLNLKSREVFFLSVPDITKKTGLAANGFLLVTRKESLFYRDWTLESLESDLIKYKEGKLKKYPYIKIFNPKTNEKVEGNAYELAKRLNVSPYEFVRLSKGDVIRCSGWVLEGNDTLFKKRGKKIKMDILDKRTDKIYEKINPDNLFLTLSVPVLKWRKLYYGKIEDIDNRFFLVKTY